MHLDQLEAGRDVPKEVNVIIEIPSHAAPIKYELDKKSGLVSVDRFLGTAMFYPCEYGFIPHTLSEDGDPVDVLVISPFPLMPNTLIRCRPVGLLRMTDESGKDAKILAVPIDKITPRYSAIQSPADVDQSLLNAIKHFFEHYKDLESGKWVKIEGWEPAEAAHQEILSSVARYSKTKEAASS
jgi:inorganic pyrophosphatase